MRMKRIAALGLLAAALAVPGIARADDVTGTVKGRVLDSTKKPVTNASVVLYHRNEKDKLEEVDHTDTNSDGMFEFKDVHDGTYAVVAYSGNKSMRDRTQAVIKNGHNDTDLELVLKHGEEQEDEKAAVKSKRDMNMSKLRVTVTDSSKDPVKNAKVRVLSGFPKEKGEYSGMREIDSGTTDADGKYAHELPEGDYTVVVTKGGKEGYHKVTINKNERASDEEIVLK